MFHSLQYLIFVGATAQLLGIATYILGTFRGDIKPNRVSWLLWSIVPLISTAASLSAGVGWVVLPVFMAGFGPFLVFICSFTNRESYWKLQKIDYICGALSLLALLLWAVTRQPVTVIAFSIIADAFASVPTIIKAWKDPATESVNPFAAGLFSSLTSFLIIKVWIFPAYAFQCYLILVNCSLVLAICHKNIFKRINRNEGL
jgi:hypothetical protein